MKDEYYMSMALELAREAAALGETPVGAVVVRGDGFIAGKGFNRRETDRNALAHAEIAAIDEACRTLGGWRLWDCTIYVTLEPCPMCSGAILNARIKRTVFGAADRRADKNGSLTSLAHIFRSRGTELCGGVMGEECERLLEEFFDKLRREKKMSNINLTEVRTDAQIEAVAAIADEIWHEWFPAILSVEQTDYMVEKFQSARAIKEQMENDGYTYYLMLKGGTRIGYTAISIHEDGRLFLSKIYIKKEYRGNGYAKEVLEFLKDYCREKGLKAIWLTVNRNNAHSIAVYEKCGFRRIGEGVTDIGGGFVMDDYYYQLDVE